MVDDVLTALQERFADVPFDARPLNPANAKLRQMCVRVPVERLLQVMCFLREDPRCRFEQLAELNGVDYLNFPEARDRLCVTYGLLSVSLGHRLWVKVFVNEPSLDVPSVTGIWQGAEWPEREVYDMFGVRFTGHPDLRRILTWEGFPAYPLRKDYPLRGRGERENYTVVTTESA